MPQEKREIKQKKNVSCMKPFASYSRRFKLNLKPTKNRFSAKFTLLLPLNMVDFFQIFVTSQSTEIPIVQNFWLGDT